MPDRKRVSPGELLMVGFEGTEIDERIRRYILHWRVGGVILFDRNIRGPEQLAGLCRRLQELRRSISDRPLLIAVDQEGGTVARVREGATVFPGNLALGFASTAEDVSLQGRITGRDLSGLGININLAPVLDLYHPGGSYSLGLRSLGSDPERVAALGTALIAGMQGEGVVATAKHFPGKGAARRDSHRELPVIEADEMTLRGRDLLPFRQAAAGGVMAMMTSHAAYPSLDRGKIRPGTLSPALMTGLLREELGFRGVLISDDLGMGAIGGYCPIEEAVRGGLAAGVDIILVCHSPAERERAFRELERIDAGEKGLRSRLEESGARIAALKSGLRPEGKPAFAGDDGDDLATRIARGAITIHPPAGSEPVLPRRFLLVWFRPERTVEVESAAGPAGPADFFREAGFDPEVAELSLDPGPEERSAVTSRLAGHRAVLLTSYDAYRFPRQRQLIEEVLRSRPDARLAVVRDPRDAGLFPGAAQLLVTRGHGPYSLRALAGILAGPGGDGE
ncbi:MAG: beta-N-acetylhexosaminidase [Candidatus Erginobacter occultus]|nr:beta-N-acetylhexosaminidase [Candidatus Erginobacter occultus]